MTSKQEEKILAATASDIATMLRQRFTDSGQVVGPLVMVGDMVGQPAFEMALEVFCEWHLVDPAGGWLEPVDRVWHTRGWQPGDRFAWHRKPFASHEDVLSRARNDERIAQAFIEETRQMLATDRRDEDGLVYLWDYRQPDRRPLLVDYMHGYATRLASAASLGGEAAWFDIAVHQFLGYANVLRDPDTGLWHLARDYGDNPGTLSPGAWSRGHGWLLRGMANTLRWLPPEHPGRPPLQALLLQTLETLAPLQDDQGMWHVLLHRPWSDSEPETSGTAFIAHAIARAITDTHLPTDPWTKIAEAAITGVCAQVDEHGTIHNVCSSPGLMWDEDELRYLHQPLPPGDPHGPPTVLYACLGAQLLT